MIWGYVYIRECNFIFIELEVKLVMFENVESVIFSILGMGVIIFIILVLVKSGDYIVSLDGIFLYIKLFMFELLFKFGVEVIFVDVVNL